MRRLSLFAIVLLAGCAPKPAPKPIDDPPALPAPKPDAAPDDNSIPPPRPVLREYTPVEGSLAYAGSQLYRRLKCADCHFEAKNGPSLVGLYGSTVKFKDGSMELADEAYIREAIRRPKSKVTAGWEPIMPAYDVAEVSEEEMTALVAYIRGMKKDEGKKEGFPAPLAFRHFRAAITSLPTHGRSTSGTTTEPSACW